MKYIKTILILTVFHCNTTLVWAQYISIDDSKSAQYLVQNVLINSSCVTVSNFSISGDNATTGQNSYGYFNNGGSNFPFKEGVVLSTWSAKNSVGPFIRNKGGGGSSWKGNADLELALNISSTNATSLEFDFIPLTNYISFNYLFASNEYLDDYPCQFSDGFAFLIKENKPGTSYQNLAVIHATTTPVSSKNIHPAISFTDKSGAVKSCSASNEKYFSGFNNSATNTSPINYAGQTVVLNSQSDVIAGASYHIKLVIADDDTEYYDSAIFLEAGSFAPKIDLGSDRLTSSSPICFGENLILDTKLPLNYLYKWYKNGVLTNITTPAYQANEAGIYKVEVTFTPSNCVSSDEIKIEYAPEIKLSNATIVQCDDNGDGITVFDLTKVDTIIKNNNATLSPVVYYESLLDAQGKINPITNPATYINKNIPPIPVVARVSNTYNCINYAQVNLVISNNSIATQKPVSTCDEDGKQDGLYHFDLNTQVTPQIISGLPAAMIVEYYAIMSDADSQKNPLPTIFNNTIANEQIIYARIVNGSDCYGIVPITLKVNTFDPPNFQEEIVSFCDESSVNLSVDSGFSSYLWNTGATDNSITVSTIGTYSVVVSDANGCTKTKKFTVEVSGIATITDATINDFTGNENSVLLAFTGVSNYEFSLDGSYFQDSPLFTGVAPGRYLAYARDKKGCGLSLPYVVYVLDYPRFFTPNSDGFNDLWRIENLDLFPKATISIFDRYGKLLKHLFANSPVWNGIFNGAELPASDYWFEINFADGKLVKGHFCLKR